jgi:hypothetical protein
MVSLVGYDLSPSVEPWAARPYNLSPVRSSSIWKDSFPDAIFFLICRCWRLQEKGAGRVPTLYIPVGCCVSWPARQHLASIVSRRLCAGAPSKVGALQVFPHPLPLALGMSHKCSGSGQVGACARGSGAVGG